MPGTPTLIHHVCGPTSDSGLITSYVLPFPGFQGTGSLSGNCIIVSVCTNTPAVTVTVTDNKSNTYTQRASVTGNQFVAIFTSPNSTAGVTSITVSLSGSGIGLVQVSASEFNNIDTTAALDGTSTGSSTSATVATGAITTTVPGDLIYQAAWQDGGVTTTSWTQGASPWKLLHADLFGTIGAAAAQYQVQAAAGSITPSLTMAPSSHFDTVAITLKPATSGTAPPAGMGIVHVYTSMWGNALTGTSQALQFPCTGNLLVAATILTPSSAVTAISDGNSNTWAFPGATFSNGGSGNVRFGYAANATTSTTMTGPTLTVSADPPNSTIILYDITGAAASPFDSTAGNPTASGTDSGTGNHTISTVAITPSTTGGFCFSIVGITNAAPLNAVTPGVFVAATSVPESSTSSMCENNGWGEEANTSTSARTYVYTDPISTAGAWAAMAVHFMTPSAFVADDDSFRSDSYRQAQVAAAELNVSIW